jgi:sec-independent protein translocase protein TatB
MEFLGIGPLELLLIVFLALIILGPKDLEKTAKNLGKGLNRLVRSDTWKTVTEASRQLRTLPTKLMRDANLEEFQNTIPQELSATAAETRNALKTWTQPPGMKLESPGKPVEPPSPVTPPPEKASEPSSSEEGKSSQ